MSSKVMTISRDKTIEVSTCWCPGALPPQRTAASFACGLRSSLPLRMLCGGRSSRRGEDADCCVAGAMEKG